MRLIERYIFRRTASAFLLALGALISVVWLTQALRQMNIVTAKGATLLAFFEITALALPFLTIVVAPFALVIATVQTLNAMNADSELVVLNASGASRMVVLRPLMALAGVIAVTMLVLSTWGSPAALRTLREHTTRINVDLVANLVRPGMFVSLEKSFTFHIASRAPDGTLGGLFVQDGRDPALTFTYTAEKANIVEMFGKTLLIMRDGVIERRTNADGNLSLIDFQSYAFDLSALTPTATAPTFRPSERPTEELWAEGGSDPDDYARKNGGRLRSELHDRFTQPLLPIVFTLIAVLALGDGRTTREGRGLAVMGTLVAVGLVRGGHFGATSAAATLPGAVPMLYGLILGTIAFVGFLIVTDRRPALPSGVDRLYETIGDAVRRALRPLATRFGLTADTSDEEDAA